MHDTIFNRSGRRWRISIVPTVISESITVTSSERHSTHILFTLIMISSFTAMTYRYTRERLERCGSFIYGDIAYWWWWYAHDEEKSLMYITLFTDWFRGAKMDTSLAAITLSATSAIQSPATRADGELLHLARAVSRPSARIFIIAAIARRETSISHRLSNESHEKPAAFRPHIWARWDERYWARHMTISPRSHAHF